MPTTFHVPVVRGGRLTLRPFEDRDAALVTAAATDPLIPRITTVPAVPDPAAALAFVRRQHERAASGTGYSFAVAGAQDEAVGQVGLWPGPDGRASVGYWVGPQHRGRGIATEALALVSRWGLGLDGIHRLEVYVEPGNTGSGRAAERVGYRREGLLRSWQAVGDERRDMLMYSLLPGDEVTVPAH